MRRGLIAAICIALLPLDALAEMPLPPGFAYLRAVAPEIVQDMRYAGPNNVTGRPVAGYGAGECILLREAAIALKLAHSEAERLGLALKVYDCYRPVRAVRAFAAWAAEPENGRTKRFYPKLRKSTLTPRYIASRSGHSVGNAVDLTLVPLQRAVPAPGGSEGDCTAPLPERETDNSLDMGSGFDCFDAKSHIGAQDITAGQQAARQQLKSLMEAAGFRNYPGEWWHYAHTSTAGRRAFDFPVKAMPK